MSDEPIGKKVDDDWKRRAQQEKAQLEAQFGGKKPAAGRRAADPGPGEEAEGDSLFSSFVETLAAQAAMMLGLQPDPMTGARRANPDQAKYLIDVLGELEAKTRGNLDPQEDRHLKMVLHELRLAYVEVTGGGRAPRESR